MQIDVYVSAGRCGLLSCSDGVWGAGAEVGMIRVEQRQLPVSPPVPPPPPPAASLLLMGELVSTFVPAGWAFLSWDPDTCLPQRSVSPDGMPGGISYKYTW